jgi:hypothetical protein
MRKTERPVSAALAPCVALAAAVIVLLAVPRLRADLVITEISYEPVAADGTPQPELEFVEIFNDGPEVYELSNYQFCRGITFVFADGVFINGRSYLVICRDQTALRAEYGISNTVGNFGGTLDNAGETLELCNPQGVGVSRSRYNDRGQWPGGAKGTGHTLSIESPYRDPDDPDSWSLSTQIGGTPGLTNFNDQATFVESVIFPDDSTWRYFKGTTNPPSSWTELSFNDSAWDSGQTGIGYSDGDDRTVLNDMEDNYASVFCRKEFNIDDVSELDECVLDVSLDDGMVVYVNDVEVARVGMPGGAIDNTTTASSTVGDAPDDANEEVTIPTNLLNNGNNVIAVSVHNTNLGSSDLSFVPRLVSRRVVLPEEIATVPVKVNEGHFRTSPAERFVELYNDSDNSVNIGGFHLTDDFSDLTKFVIPGGTTIPGKGWVVFTEAQLGFDLSVVDEVRERVEIALSNSTGSRVVHARVFEPKVDELSEASFPDGEESYAPAATPTPGAANAVAVVRDVVFNEIMYNSISSDDRYEFVELYNRGAVTHDIGGWVIEGIGNYTFAPGTTIGPGDYLVVAKSPTQLRNVYGLDSAVVLDTGYTGGLADGGERLRLRDLNNNEADKVSYSDGGEWSRWADGSGSSLERIDPNGESSVATTWDASDDSSKATTRRYSYSARNGGGESDFGMLLLAEGIAIVDNVSLVRSGSSTNLISNGTFDSNTSGWRIEGTHACSGRTNDSEERITGGGSMKLISWNGGGDYKVNRIETNTGSQSNGQTYTITFDARWQVGSASILTIGDYNMGNPSSAGLAGSTFMSVPTRLGSPGEINSSTERQIGRFGSSNQGPAIDKVRHSPCVPGSGQQVVVKARVRDPQGVDRVRVFYRTNTVTGSFSNVTMVDDDGNGIYSVTLPGQSLGTRVIYYIEAEDDSGRTERFPRDILNRAHPPVANPSNASNVDELYCIYRHDTRLPSTNYHSYRFILHEEHEQELRNRRLLSNKMLEGSFVFGGDDCYYGSRLRFAGSPWQRGNGGAFEKSYAIKVPKDDPLHGRKSAFNLDEHGSNGRERFSHWLLRKNAGNSKLPYFDFHALVRFQLNDVETGTYEALDKPNRQYIDFWFKNDSDGPHYEMDDRFGFNDSGSRTGSQEGKVLYPPYGSTGLGSSKENFRWYFALRNHKTADDFSPLQQMCRLFDPRTTSSSNFDRTVYDMIDVDEFLRVLAIELNIAHWDTWGGNRGKNCYFYQAPSDGKWRLIPWDLELTYGNVNDNRFALPTNPNSSIGNHFTEISRFLSRPMIKRKYYGIMKNMIDRFFRNDGSSPLTRYASRLSGSGVSSIGTITGFIGGRRNYLLSRMNAAAYPAVRLRITTNSGNNFTHVEPLPFIDLEGESPVEVCNYLVTRNGDFIQDLEFEFSTSDIRDFTIEDIPLIAGQNEIEILGINDIGEIIDMDSITITSTGGWDAPVVDTVNPSPAPAGSILRIDGSEFRDDLRVYFNGGSRVLGEDIEFDEGADPTTILVTLPESTPPGVVTVEVENIDSQSSNLVELTVLPPAPKFIRMDSNMDTVIDISDPLVVVRHLFAGLAVDCQDSLDADDDGELAVTDAIYGLDYIFRNGDMPPAPFPILGHDATDGDALGCETGL